MSRGMVGTVFQFDISSLEGVTRLKNTNIQTNNIHIYKHTNVLSNIGNTFHYQSPRFKRANKVNNLVL